MKKLVDSSRPENYENDIPETGYSFIEELAKSKRGQKVVLLTRKKDRSITIEVNEAKLILTEQGYENFTRELPLGNSNTKHALLVAFKKEFPRSHRVYVTYD